VRKVAGINAAAVNVHRPQNSLAKALWAPAIPMTHHVITNVWIAKCLFTSVNTDEREP
jgi:hypothetical protein